MRARATALALVALAASGCTAISYYAQAIGGHFEMTRRAAPIEERVRDESTPASLKARLERAESIRDFASRALGLPDNGAFRRYADLGRPYVVWNVFAAPPFELRAKESCFLLVGCVAYRGYYSKDAAERQAAELAAGGYDVFVAGVPAYSTLGWFDDPLLNTFINYPAPELARLIFHELAHQVVYVKDDTTFNESFATAVERAGLRRWLDAQGTDEDRAQQARAAALRQAFHELIDKYRALLLAHYGSTTDTEALRAGKERLFAALRAEYDALRQEHKSFAGLDRFFVAPNNAMLVSIATYTQRVPAFEHLLARENDDLPRFYAAVRALAKLPKDERDERLARFDAESSHSPAPETRSQ